MRFVARILLMLVLLTALAGNTHVIGQVASQADRLVDQLASVKGDEYWRTIRDLEALGNVAIPALEKGLVRPEPMVRIGAAKAIFALGRKKDAVHTLMTIIGEKDRDAQVRAAEVLWSVTRGATDFGDTKELTNRLVKILDITFDRPLKIAICKAIHSISGDALAMRELKNLLNSSDPSAQEAAALALAEMDNFEPAMPVLKKLAQDPSPKGRLAKALLNIKTLQDRQLRDLETPEGEGKYQLLDEIMRYILDRYVDAEKIKRDDLIAGAASGMVNTLDVFSEYLDEKRLQRLNEDITLEYGGIGAHVSMRDEILTIERPIYNGPAYRAGLRSLDRILEVEGLSTRGKTIEELVRKLRGKPGTPVKLKVARRGWEKPRDMEIVREEIKIPTVKSEMLPGSIGYIQIVSFSEETPVLFGEELNKLVELGAKALIIDVRNNSGGVLSAPRGICEYFLDRGKLVVTTRIKGDEIVQKLETRDDSNKVNLPLVVLVNYGSASASEILAGALQDHNRAIIIGERTYGKGSVQNIISLRTTQNATAIRLTTAKYYLPSGRAVDRERKRDTLEEKTDTGGVLPDIVVEPPKRNYWKDEHLSILLDSPMLEKYISEHFESNKEKLTALAEGDDRDPAKYPGFEELYEKSLRELNVRLDRNDVREALRERVRREVADRRGQEFLTDVQEDIQLQRAIVELFSILREEITDVPQYRLFADKFTKKDEDKSEK